ncbi:cyclase family protein [Aquimarina sp. 2201CG5-10]|uniref:cyclase family protein n=1 Tax=Aquimarina callyspongiae TaxID=3098150 RepID=UPI002AB3CE78|nr:cyclase family protein [Aquimarina sp. 2201CG5-10]MDY8138545.1 cyclase family protein [Aquimarina sp. 2201CG5-10]
MSEIIDLSQEIYEGMPVYKSLPQVKMSIHNTHEEWDGVENPITSTPSVYKIEMGEHTGTHVDAINHMAKEYKEQSIDIMPLSMFYTEGICLDFSYKSLKELITSTEIKQACNKANLKIKKGDTILLYTNHYRKYFTTENWGNGPGITAEATRWLGQKEISAFGVETMSPGVPGVSNKEVHKICGELNFTHYENMINLHLLIGRGRFRFIGLPLKIRGGTGSPVRAIAVFED